MGVITDGKIILSKQCLDDVSDFRCSVIAVWGNSVVGIIN